MADLSQLQAEYVLIQGMYEGFDDRALLIKGWSITVGLLGLAKAVELKNTMIAKLSAAAACLFWVTEAIWKGFQQAFVPRIEQIEAVFGAGGPDAADVSALQIYNQWQEAGWVASAVKWFIFPHVALPHIVILVLSIYVIRTTAIR